VFRVDSRGCLQGKRVDSTHGVRPVINLKTSTTFLSGDYDGSIDKPFIVKI